MLFQSFLAALPVMFLLSEMAVSVHVQLKYTKCVSLSLAVPLNFAVRLKSSDATVYKKPYSIVCFTPAKWIHVSCA